MTKVCTHGRKKDVAMRMLEESLTRLQTDHLDVWQVHEVIYYNDPEKAYEPDGVLEALAAAKQQGKVRFVRIYWPQKSVDSSRHAESRIPLRHRADAHQSLRSQLSFLRRNKCCRSRSKRAWPSFR